MIVVTCDKKWTKSRHVFFEKIAKIKEASQQQMTVNSLK